MLLKKREEHFNVYSKKEAISMLKTDNRVLKIQEKNKNIIIETRPIKLEPTLKECKKINICPIGKYIITIFPDTFYNNRIGIIAKRKNGPIPDSKNIAPGWHTHHINDSFTSSGICWGNIYDIASTLKKNNDIYWLVKITLDLICDSEPEIGHESSFKRIFIYNQIRYAYESKNKNYIQKTQQLYFRTYGCLDIMRVLEGD